jgi:hypothetical protein
MVKYVEGSFDDDYVQTLGMFFCFPVWRTADIMFLTLPSFSRGKLHAEAGMQL